MIKILSLIAIAIALLLVGTAPYIAATLYATVSVLQPQHVWFWAFTGISIFKISAGIAIIAWFIHMARGKLNWQIYNNGIFYGMLMMCIILYLSDVLSPFPDYRAAVSSTVVLDIYTTIVLMFFITLGLLNSTIALKCLIGSLVGCTLYYTFWANSAYFDNNWAQFTSGRLDGPSGSPYKDSNVFSILFVIGLPFILFAIYQVDKKWQKAILIFTIPFIWHALVLCASRGALLSAGVTTIVAALMIKSKPFNLALVAGFVFFVVDQGAQVVSRTTDTVQRTNAQEPINPRIISWQTGAELVLKHPVLGVGPQRFLEASRYYYPGRPMHVAHNTLLNFSANTGLIAGFIYLSFFWISRKMYKWNKKTLEDSPHKLHDYINKASICSLVGFFVGAFFLDLIIFEPFYFLLLIIVTNNFLLKQRIGEKSTDTFKSEVSLPKSSFAYTRKSIIS